MAPRTRMPDSFVTQSGWNKISFNIGSKKGSKSSLNTVAKTSKAAAEHFPKIKKLNGFYTVYMFSNSYLYERSLIIVRNIFMVVQYLFLIL